MTRRSYGTGSLYEKDGSWYVRWRDRGGRHAQRIGAVKSNTRRDGLTKREAESKVREILLAADAVASKPSDRTTVAEIGAALLMALQAKGRKPSHIRSTGYHISVHIDPLLGDLEARMVLPDDVRRLVDKMLREGKSPKMVRNVVGTFHGVLRLAVERGLLDRNPCDGVELPAVPHDDEIRFLTELELQRVVAALPDAEAGRAEHDHWPVTRLMVLTASLTGMRLGELRALRWRDLDMGASKVRVTHSFVRGQLSSPKSRKSVRAIPLASALMRELDEHHRSTVWNQDDDFVLAHPHTGRPMDDTKMRENFKATLQRANVRPVRIHDLRHTFATIVARSGTVSIRTLQEWMGHEHLMTTQIYAAFMPGERDQQLLDAAFEAFGEVSTQGRGGHVGGQSVQQHRESSAGISRKHWDAT